jgi:hypothetical protein
VRSIVRTGFQLFFKQPLPSPPPPRQLPPQLRSAVQQLVEEYLRLGAVELCEHPTPYLTPVFAVPKGSGGWRLIHDLRPVNSSLALPPKFVLDDLTSVLPHLQPHQWYAKVDISNAYLHVPIEASSRHFVAFCAPGSSNTVYQWAALPFGLSWSPFVFTRVLRPVIRRMRKAGYQIFAYLDDLLLMGPSQFHVLQGTQLLLSLLCSLGWTVHLTKSVLTPTQCVDFLGTTIDSRSATCRLPTDRVRLLQNDIHKVLARGAITFTALRRFMGKIVAARHGVWGALLLSRGLQRLFGPARVRRVVPLSTSAILDLQELLNLLSHNRGLPFPSTTPTSIQWRISSDASLDGAGAALHEVHPLHSDRWIPRDHFHRTWTWWEKEFPICVLEARALRLAVQRWAHLIEGCRLLLRSDATTVVPYINRQGGRSLRMHREARRIHHMLLKHHVSSMASYLPGVHNGLADFLSRFPPRNKLTVTNEVLQLCTTALEGLMPVPVVGFQTAQALLHPDRPPVLLVPSRKSIPHLLEAMSRLAHPPHNTLVLIPCLETPMTWTWTAQRLQLRALIKDFRPVFVEISTPLSFVIYGSQPSFAPSSANTKLVTGPSPPSFV